MKPDINEKALRLISYLEELSKMRSKVIRLIDDYDNIFWLKDVPHEKGCFTHAWGPTDADPDLWLEFTKQPEPKLRDVPEDCEEWIENPEDLFDSSTVPVLKDSITVSEDTDEEDLGVELLAEEIDEKEGESEGSEKTLYLADFPHVSELWDVYIETEWKPWAEKHDYWERIQTAYSKLFTIHQEQLKLGEKYELVLGIGLLTWKTPKGQLVRRHLITTRATLIFEANLGRFIVGPQQVGTPLNIEIDMLDIETVPLQAVENLKPEIESAEGNPWDNATVNTVLESLVNSLSSDGTSSYHSSTLDAPTSCSEKLAVYNAPALILRKRSVRGLKELLKNMRSHIEGGGIIPPEFSDLAESGKKVAGADDDFIRSKEPELSKTLPKEVYFPAPANREQLLIVDRLNHSTGVIVQGPPGTGKSHTIANLIAHFLASGERVLVTAKTPRALKVLHEKIHPKIRPLCINFIGDMPNEQRSLEQSVQAVLAMQDSWDQGIKDQELAELESRLANLKKQQAETQHRIRSIREKDTKTYSLVDGAYVGTAAKIAKKVKSESAEFDWFSDQVEYDSNLDINLDQLREVYHYYKRSAINNGDVVDHSQLLPEIGTHVPTSNHFGELVQKETELKKLAQAPIDYSNGSDLHPLNTAQPQIVRNLLAKLESLHSCVENIRRRPMPWIHAAIDDMLSDNDTPWKELRNVTAESLSGLREQARAISEQNLVIPWEIDTRKMIDDVKFIMKQLAMRGRLKGLIFTPKDIRDRSYIYEDIQLNGSPCISQVKLQALLNVLEVKAKIDYVWNMWRGKADRKDAPFSLQVAEQEELLEALGQVISIYDYLEDAKEAVGAIPGLSEPLWHKPESVNALLTACRALFAAQDLIDVKKLLADHESKLRHFCCQDNVNPIGHEMLCCIENRDSCGYAQLTDNLEHLSVAQSERKRLSSLVTDLREKVPLLIDEISRSPDDPSWVSRLAQFEDAWNWRRVSRWLIEYLDESALERHESRLDSIEQEIRETKASIAELKAWTFCFQRMTEAHRRRLVAWQLAVKKLGKGTGKHASKNRRDAQENLRHCKTAIPAWIMPLHRVYETAGAEPGIFDTIIVDEASQCGFEGLPLTFLCKRLVVVGDDQQISPEAVGLNQAVAHRLADKYLYDFEYKTSFDVSHSLFDHANMRFSTGKMVLREHFRCMPEIIRFSNDLCYSDTPLIPLRQYPPKRLMPVKSTYVTSGYREGSGSHSINRPEAEAIVERIVSMCHDERYDGKTIGVITLLGHAQARLIEDSLLAEIGPQEYESRNIVCGEAYSFQGDERDVILLSCVVATNERIGVLSKETDRRRLNVAASRAKDQMWMFHSVMPDQLSPSCMRRRLLDFFLNPTTDLSEVLGEETEALRKRAFLADRSIESPPKPFDSWFEVDVTLDIATRGYRVIPQFSVAGRRIDLVIEGLRSRLAVECYGDFWHGPDKFEDDNIRKRQLERCGWTFHIIRECEYYANPTATMERLLQKCEFMGIDPVMRSSASPSTPEQGTSDDLQTSEVESVVVDDEGEKAAETNEVRPTDVHEAMRLQPADIESMIVKVLKKRPNYSCILDKLPGYILKDWEIRTRGVPRQKFSTKVNRTAKQLGSTGRVEIYKSRNVRIRLRRTL